jgi:hypothetical protein
LYIFYWEAIDFINYWAVVVPERGCEQGVGGGRGKGGGKRVEDGFGWGRKILSRGEGWKWKGVLLVPMGEGEFENEIRMKKNASA